jgi:hypothetical protein
MRSLRSRPQGRHRDWRQVWHGWLGVLWGTGRHAPAAFGAAVAGIARPPGAQWPPAQRALGEPSGERADGQPTAASIASCVIDLLCLLLVTS